MERLPETLPFAATFKGVLAATVNNCYSRLENPESYASKEDFDCDLSMAIDETLTAIGFEYPEGSSLDWLGDLYDLAEEIGLEWREPEDEEVDDE